MEAGEIFGQWSIWEQKEYWGKEGHGLHNLFWFWYQSLTELRKVVEKLVESANNLTGNQFDTDDPETMNMEQRFMKRDLELSCQAGCATPLFFAACALDGIQY